MTLPPRPWDWVCSEKTDAGGRFNVYITDATGKKIMAVWAKANQREEVADTIIKLVNALPADEPTESP